MSVHENSKNHRQCFTQWKELERNLFYNRGIIDAELQQQIQRENQKWCDILKRLLHCIKYLAMQNLALRGHRESLQPNAYTGNLLGLLKQVSNFDPVIKDHLKFAKSHPGSNTYLSPNIQNEFIHIIASTVRANLLKKVHKAKYYGVMFDSTPDLAHCEQMSEVVRSKCYDNAAVKAGQQSGVHQKIKGKKNFVIFVNCDNHSLNLVDVHAAKEEIAVPINLKSDFDTRWNAKAESVKPVHTYIDEIVEVFQNLMIDESASNETKSDAKQLCNRILTYDFLPLLGFWNKVLGRIDSVRKWLLQDYFQNESEVLVNDSIKKGVQSCHKWCVEFERRQRGKKKGMDGEMSRDVGLTAKEEMDRLCFNTEINHSKDQCKKFGEVYSSDVDGQELYKEILDCKMMCSIGVMTSNECKVQQDVIETLSNEEKITISLRCNIELSNLTIYVKDILQNI
ncbi:uncharacterized protein LOC136093743 [Hydra vulgaris]|uniref:uncharacterized protein LOC136093743 n=1 Tax=Hydra vulgaris TaxID=6087 RepID=UPI0032E9C624